MKLNLKQISIIILVQFSFVVAGCAKAPVQEINPAVVTNQAGISSTTVKSDNTSSVGANTNSSAGVNTNEIVCGKLIKSEIFDIDLSTDSDITGKKLQLSQTFKINDTKNYSHEFVRKNNLYLTNEEIGKNYFIIAPCE